MNRTIAPAIAVAMAALAASATSTAQVSWTAAREVSLEAPATGGATPGGLASKVKLERLTKTPGGVHDARLIAIWGDANHDQPLWEPKGLQHLPRDIYARFSDDDGATWSTPVNLSNTARHYSALTDWDGDGVATPYFGDSEKPNAFSSGDIVVVSWIDKYVPEPGWAFGQNGSSSIQGRVEYPDLATYPNTREVPYAAVYVAVSADGGETWIHGGQNPPLQLTYGRRDAKSDVHKGSGNRWVITWQEDPEGLQPGEAEGPGTGASGANVTNGTDVWYSWTANVVTSAQQLRLNRVPLTNHSVYDTTTTDGYPIVGNAGANEHHGASRPNINMANVGGVFTALLAYEETKGNQILQGKTVQYHAFPFDAPILAGTADARIGDPGYSLSPLMENSRRVRFVIQQPDGVNPAIAIFWRQGFDDQGAPADVMVKTATTFDGAALVAAPAWNLSSNTPIATAQNLLDTSDANPIEDAKAHRGYLRGPLLVIGYSYTPNGPLARYTDLANYNFWVRRSIDGGASWLPPQDVTQVTDTKVNVVEPRLVGPAKTGTEDGLAFVVGWGTETNPYDGIGVKVPLDLWLTRTRDGGETFEPKMPIVEGPNAELESQIRVDDDSSNVFAVWNREGPNGQQAEFARGGHPVLIEVVGTPTTAGGRVDFHLVAPNHGGEQYVMAASLASWPGAEVPGGVLPLNPDPMLFLSLAEPGYFVDFMGDLDPAGEANPYLLVPDLPGLTGFAFQVAFVAIPPAGPWAISNPRTVWIE